MKIGKTLDSKKRVSPLAYVKTVKVRATLPPKLKKVVKNERFPVDLFL